MQRLLPLRLSRLLLPSTSSNIPSSLRRFSSRFIDDDPTTSNAPDSLDKQSSSSSSSPSPSSTPSSSWSLGLSPDDYEGPAVGLPSEEKEEKEENEDTEWLGDLRMDTRKDRDFVDGWDERYKETCALMRQVREPGSRGSYLKESEKAEIYRLHRLDPDEYSVDRLARDFRIMRQRVHAILWLKELEEREEKRTGSKLDDSVEKLLDEFPEFFISHDKEFHIASLPYKPAFKVMPMDWDGTTKDPDEVLYEISMKEDATLYKKFVQNMEFCKKKMAGEVFYHKYSRRRPSKGWNTIIEKLGARDKRLSGNALRFVSLPDGSGRKLNELEKLYATRETSLGRRRKILPH